MKPALYNFSVWYRGATVPERRVTIRDGADLVLYPNAVISGWVRAGGKKGEKVFEFSFANTLGADGSFIINSFRCELAAGEYYYDIFLGRAGSSVAILEGKITVEQNVTT